MGKRNNKSGHSERSQLERCNQKVERFYKLRPENTENMARQSLRLLEMGAEVASTVPTGQTSDCSQVRRTHGVLSYRFDHSEQFSEKE